MIPLTIEVDTRRVEALFAQLPTAMLTRLRPTFDSLRARMHAGVFAREPARSGRLRSDTHSFIHSGKDFIRASVRILPEPGERHNVKAAALNYGVRAWFNVNAYQMLRGYFESPVRAYKRHVQITGLHFLENTLAEIAPVARSEIERAVSDATQGVIA